MSKQGFRKDRERINICIVYRDKKKKRKKDIAIDGRLWQIWIQETETDKRV